MVNKELTTCLVRWKKEKVPIKTIIEQTKKLGYDLTAYKINKIINEYNNSLCERSGVYLLLKNGRVMYVGQSNNLDVRLNAHHYGFGLDVLCIEVSPEKLTLVENKLVRKYHPPFNGKFNKKFKIINLKDLDTIVTNGEEKCT